MSNTAATAPTFRLAINFDSRKGTAVPQDATVEAVFGTVEEAAAWVATQPKALGLRATTLTSYIDGPAGRTVNFVGYIQGRAILIANGINGGKNETGIKRMNRWIKDLNIEFVAQYSNSYPTLGAALAAI